MQRQYAYVVPMLEKLATELPFKPEGQRAHSFPFGYLENVATVIETNFHTDKHEITSNK